MNLTNATALVTGANRGIGRALVDALLAAGAKRVYAAARDPKTVDASDKRVVPLRLDVTDAASIATLPMAAPDLTLLINNAGGAEFGSALEAPDAAFEQDLALNYLGPLRMSRALAPTIERNGGGAIVNVLTIVSFAPFPALAAYSASKAASWSMTQSLRGTLAAKGIAVHAVFPGPVDTDAARGITLPKAQPADVARAIIEGIAAGQEDILPDPMSRQVYAGWKQDHKAIEKQFATG
jgi:NAD(P)-dependent dehydrogenase (short-subunit alcohol dehydrogenase family)